MLARPPTKPLTPRLSEAARHVIVPKGIVSTGWPAVCKKCTEFGVNFRSWQEGAGRIILAKREDGTYASTVGGTGMSIPRQVGKTFLVGAIIFALCILLPNLTVIWTAHRLRTAEETFGKMQVFARRKLISPHILKITLGSGEEEIRFRNGSRILFGARERGFGRGFDEVDVLVFDEAQLLSESALDDMIPATNQSRQPTGALLLFLGTPPKPTDPGEVFTRMRTEALTGEDDDTAWVEFGADPDFRPTPQPAPLTDADWVQVAKANPSFPHDTPRAAILRMRKKLGPDSFLREGLGIWSKGSSGPLDLTAWLALEDPSSTAARLAAYGLEVSKDRAFAAVAVGGPRGDGRVHVELIPAKRGESVFLRRGTAGLIERCQELNAANPAPFAVDGSSETKTLIADLEKAGLNVLTMSAAEAAAASSGLAEAVRDKTVSPHGPRPELHAAIEAAKLRLLGDGMASLGRRVSTGDITALLAVRNAHWATDLGYNVLDSAY
jgi:hypothetical protein